MIKIDNCKNLDDTALVKIKSLLSLEDLGLSNCPITNNGLKTICELVNLKKLNLQRTNIDNNGISVLNSLKKLILVDLRWTKVDQDGVSSLQPLNFNLRYTPNLPPQQEQNQNDDQGDF